MRLSFCMPAQSIVIALVYLPMWTNLIIHTILSLEPNIPRNLRENATAKSLTVTWDAATENVTWYSVELKNESNAQKNVTVPRTTFVNLTPDTMYTVVVMSVIGDDDTGYEDSSPLEVDVYTSK